MDYAKPMDEKSYRWNGVVIHCVDGSDRLGLQLTGEHQDDGKRVEIACLYFHHCREVCLHVEPDRVLRQSTLMNVVLPVMDRFDEMLILSDAKTRGLEKFSGDICL